MTVEKIKKNFLASMVVFFVAIPLCLGIALASGASLFSGIITGCIGGVVVGLISASRVSVSGPAAGMVAVVLTTVDQLGNYDAFLLALLFAGILQIIGGALRGGFIANYVPATVVKGLLAAIGLTIVIKQIPLAVGYLGGPFSLDEMLKTAQENGVISSIPHLLTHVNIGATLISILSFMVLFFWDKICFQKIKIMPSAIIVVILGVIVNLLYEHFWPSLLLESRHLVNIPVANNLQDFLSQFNHPDFSAFTNEKVYFYGVMIAIVASLETLLNLEAIEKIDKQHRYCSRNRELIAQGVGNICSSLVGGLPITSVIVRSSVNINAGANDKLSTILHGLLLLISLTFMARWLNYIPIAALATILIYTGLKLAKLSLFIEVYQKGPRYFIPFIVTIIAILWFNLLFGILIGLATSILFILQRNSKNCFSVVDEQHPSGEVLRLVLPQ
ncbi:MAG: SulP family inorganic anion transporter, partial [Gammaproteobacteria bacterium]